MDDVDDDDEEEPAGCFGIWTGRPGESLSRLFKGGGGRVAAFIWHGDA